MVVVSVVTVAGTRAAAPCRRPGPRTALLSLPFGGKRNTERSDLIWFYGSVCRLFGFAIGSKIEYRTAPMRPEASQMELPVPGDNEPADAFRIVLERPPAFGLELSTTTSRTATASSGYLRWQWLRRLPRTSHSARQPAGPLIELKRNTLSILFSLFFTLESHQLPSANTCQSFVASRSSGRRRCAASGADQTPMRGPRRKASAPV